MYGARDARVNGVGWNAYGQNHHIFDSTEDVALYKQNVLLNDSRVPFFKEGYITQPYHISVKNLFLDHLFRLEQVFYIVKTSVKIIQIHRLKPEFVKSGSPRAPRASFYFSY